MQRSQVRLEIGADPREVGRARSWARARLAGSGVTESDEQLAETVVLLVSELVTNAVVHTGRPAVLCLSFPGPGAVAGALRVEVADASGSVPLPRHAEGEDTGGRGLELVSGLADRWGWHHEGGGKRIWCEFDGVPSGGEAAAADPRTACSGPPAEPVRPPAESVRPPAESPRPSAQRPRPYVAPTPPRPRAPLTLRPLH